MLKSIRGKIIVMIAAFALLAMPALLAGCNAGDGSKSDANSGAKELSDRPVIHETEFGGVYITSSIDDFNALGYEYGDSVDVTFSNGYELKDLPYYNGFYTQIGEPLLVAYPGYEYIKVTINSGDDLWKVAELSEDDTATVTLNTRGEYMDIQDARDIHYVDGRSEFESDEVYANFRAVSVGSIKENILYRSASPCDDQHGRAGYADRLMEEAGVKFVLDLADDDEKIQGYLDREDFDSPHFRELYDAGNVEPVGLSMSYASEDFRSKLADGLSVMAHHDGPYLVHCTEGKDRTGFVCMLLEALAGASYDEILDDYMVTYYNYYKIDEESDPERYGVIADQMLVPMIEHMAGDPSVDAADAGAGALQEYAENYLKAGGMTEADLDILKAEICLPAESK